MIELTIPGQGTLQIHHLVCDVNGTLAVDGQLVEGIARRFASLRDRLQIHLLTADTHGHQSLIDQQLGLTAMRIQPGREVEQKASCVNQLGAEQVIAIGQGNNDAQMLSAAAIGISLLSPEGLAVEALNASDLLMPNILSALDLLENPVRLIATLRK